MTDEQLQAIKEIEEKIKATEERFNAGKVILIQVKQQLKVLKGKLKEYRHLQSNISAAADGDL